MHIRSAAISSSSSASPQPASSVGLSTSSLSEHKNQVEAAKLQEGSWWFVTAPAMMSGAVMAVLFNPFDRALYLRVHHRRGFFHKENWTAPFQGFANAAVYRTICSASYLVWQDTARRELHVHCPDLYRDHKITTQLIIGLFAGTMNGLLLNQLQIIKYRMWTEGNGTFWSVSRRMLQEGGRTIFFRGVGVSVARDAVFGTFYEVLRSPSFARERHGEWGQFCLNVAAACTASCLSSPLNYCRNVVYGAPLTSCPLRVWSLVSHMRIDWKREETLVAQFRHINTKLNLGWGSFRVGLGMGIGQGVFQWSKNFLHGPSA